MVAYVLLALLAISGIIAGLFVFLPWYLALAGLVALGVGLRFAGGYLLKQLFLLPFKAKGKVLHGARVEVHGVTPAPPPETPPDEAARRWFHVDLTIRPGPAEGSFQLWEPGELRLAALDAKAIDEDDEDDRGLVHDLELHQDGAFVKDEGIKWGGAQRVRLHVGVKPEVRELQLRYYFELFGKVAFPA